VYDVNYIMNQETDRHTTRFKISIEGTLFPNSKFYETLMHITVAYKVLPETENNGTLSLWEHKLHCSRQPLRASPKCFLT